MSKVKLLSDLIAVEDLSWFIAPFIISLNNVLVCLLIPKSVLMLRGLGLLMISFNLNYF